MSSVSKLATETSRPRHVIWSGEGMPASDGAGVKLSRILGQPRLPDLDPFLMLDEFRSDDPDAYMAGFPDHPHRGFETVTYMLAGRLRHRDNKGHEGLLTAGSVQWMTAGRGIVHSEMPEQEQGPMQGFQLWINLPAKDKMGAPRYQELAASEIPTVPLAPGAEAKLIAGEIADRKGPVEPGATAPFFADLHLAAQARVTLPLADTHNAFAYVYEGSAAIGTPGTNLARGRVAVLSQGSEVAIVAGDQGARLLLLAGKPLGEPVAKYGPFVMNSEAELRQAILDYQAGRF